MVLSVALLMTASYYTVRNSMPTKLSYDSIPKSIIEQTIVDIEYKASEADASVNTLFQKDITQVVIHHTATDSEQDVQKLHKAITKNHTNRWIRWGIIKTGQQMMYHRLIGSDGTILGDKDFNEIWWGTRENNVGVIHIALQWNFNDVPPTEAQYETLQQVLWTLEQRYWEIKISWHWELEWERTACPWKLFDYTRIQKTKAEIPTIQNTPPSITKIYKNVRVKWKRIEVDNAIQYTLTQCNKKITDTGKYSCYNMVLTFNAENWNWDKDAKSKTNTNWTTDYGICQLNSEYHSTFINSPDFKYSEKQIDYCIAVWQDAKLKKVMPRKAFDKRFERWKNVLFW